MRISDWSSDVCSSDLLLRRHRRSVMLDQFLGHHRLKPAEVDDRVEITVETIEIAGHGIEAAQFLVHVEANGAVLEFLGKMPAPHVGRFRRSEEHTSELQSLMRISYAVFCLKKKKEQTN